MSTTPISPKVTAGASTGAIVGLLLSYASSVQPDMFAFLGKWQGFAFLLFTLAVSGVAAWWKKDALRVAQETATDATQSPSPLVDAPPAAATSFAPTQAKLDALPAPEPVAATEVTPVYTAP
jgi:hypothetical protein